MVNKLFGYIKESKEELKKVTWPTRKQTVRHTLIVIGVCAATAVFLGLLDYFLNLGLTKIIR